MPLNRPWKDISVFAITLALWMLAGRPVSAVELGSGTLQVAGTRLAVSPEAQTVPFNTPTIVETQLVGYSAAEGALPAGLRVLADFTGPEIDGVLVLETVPGEPFRIPRLSLKGQYQLDNIRLVEGDDLLAYAEPRSAGVLVTQVLVTSVSSRPLTLDEIRSYGVILGDQNFQAFNFTFGFAVGGKEFDYNLPILYSPAGGGRLEILGDLAQGGPGGSMGTTAARFVPPQMVPFNLELEPRDEGEPVPVGGCGDAEGNCFKDDPVTLPGVILFPTDVTLLHQFFSVVLLAQNGAPEGDALRIRDLTARVVLPNGLRMAETEPPTPLGVPVPVLWPGPDGKLGTADDLTFLVAQAEGRVEAVVEGLQQGTHIVEFQLDGTLDGLPGHEVRRISGTARGAVVVRDPTLSMTITHPDVVRADEPYSLLLTVANTSASPVNLLSIALPPTGLSGVELAPGETNQKTLATLLPGDAEVVRFNLVSRRTGRVVASSVRSASAIDPHFELVVGVGEEGIPLSPTALVLPRSTQVLPEPLVRRGLALLGLGWSLATAPAALNSGLPRPGLEQVHEKVYWLAQAGRYVSLGEEPFDSLAVLALEWSGARDHDWEWDGLRRRTQKGGLWAEEIGKALSAGASTPLAAFERFAGTTAFLVPGHGALAVGTNATLEVESRSSGKRIAGLGTDAARVRDLPFADLYRLAGGTLSGSGQMVALAVPEENGYRARLRVAGGGTADLHLVVPGSGGTLRRVSWPAVNLGANGVATADFRASFADGELVLALDADGDGVVEETRPGAVSALARRPFTAVAAVQNAVDPSGHMIEVLFTQDVDLASLLPGDPDRFRIPGKVSNGGLVPVEEDLANFYQVVAQNPFAGLRDTRIVRVVFDNPVSPLVTNQLTIRDLKGTGGQLLSNVQLPVTTTVTDPGVEVRGTVYGPDGLPVPFAKVELFETDFFYYFPTPCRQHKTAAVAADAQGRFHFDYVRQTTCGDVFSVTGTEPGSGRHGTSRARVRFVNGTMEVDVVMLGRGTIRGRVRYDDGTIPSTLDVIAYSPVFFEGREARLGPDGTYEVGDLPVGTVTLGANDRQGGYVFQTVEIPSAGAVVVRDLTILRRPSTRAVGQVRGVVHETDGTTPVFNAYLALYANGELVGVERSGLDGRFDFGLVPAGRAEIEAFDGETGLTGAQVQFDVGADQVEEVTLRLRDDRGTVEGHVYQQTLSTVVPLAGVVVWVSGTPFNTVTDASGYYRLDGVFAGDRSVLAADLAHNRQTSAQVSLTGNGGRVTRDLYFVESVGSGLSGEVIGFSGNPVPGAKVHLSAGGDQWFGEAVTDAAGRFVFPNLQVGSYQVHAFKGMDGGTQQATIRFQGETPFVRVQFKRGAIHGTVKARNESGQLVGVTALVTYRTTVVRGELVGLDWEAHTLETRADGTFDLPNVLVGDYVLTVSNAFHGEKTVRGELVYAGEVAEHSFTFEPNGTIRGVVLDPDGVTPAAGATVHLRHPNFSIYDLTTDAAGRFRFELVPPGGRFPIEATWSSGTVSRQAQVWVSFTQPGQELDVEIRLPRQGTVAGYVEDANGAPVPGAVVTLQEHAFPQRNLIQNADGEGRFSYTNIFAGTVSLSAKAPSLGGLGAKKTVEITTEGQEVLTLLTLEATGEIIGRVLSPETLQPVATAQVTLYRGNSLFDTVTSDASGAFRFRLLPLGTYTVWVFDPRVGRHGRGVDLTLGQNGQVLETDVILEARGNVLGHLYEPASTLGIPGATVRLETSSLAPFITYSSTDVDGFFAFEGIPEGEFRLATKEPEGRRRATGSGEITAEDQDVLVDLYLEDSGRVLGSVYQPAGATPGLFPNSNTLIYQDGQVVGATLANPFSFEGIIAGRDFELRAFEVGGDHQAYQRGRLVELGEEATVELTMAPRGGAAVTVRDSFDNPVAGAAVTVHNNGFYGLRVFQGSTAADGRVVFSGAGEGPLSVYATHPVTGLRGSGGGTIAQEGQVVEVAVRLEDSGRLRGRAVRPDGTTPAVGALVTLAASGRSLQVLTDADGAFSFASVPLGAFSFLIQEHLGAGEIQRGGTLASNGQEIDFGPLVLDGALPFVTALAPAAGSRDLPLATAVTIDFSEPVDRTRYNGNWLAFRTLSGRYVAFTLAWQANDARMVLTPTAPLDSFTGYEVIVYDAVDLAGRRLADRVKTVFHTVDVVPPNVLDVLPRDGQSQVPLTTLLKVTFTEPVAFASLSGNAFQLTDLTTGQGVGTTFLQLAGEREVLLTPIGGLVNDHRYQIRVQGVRDAGGNTMAQAVTTTFWTPDTIPPQIQSVSPANGTGYTAGDRMTVAVTATDERGLGAATLSYNGWTFTDAAAPYEWSVPAPVVGAASDVTLTVQVKDVFGNASTATRTVHVTPRINADPPQVEIACAVDGDAVVPGVEAEFILRASDDEAIESHRFLVNGQVQRETAPVDQATAEASFLWAPPASATAGTSYLIRVEARDFAGNVGFRELTVSIPTGTILKGSRSLTSAHAGQALVLAAGTFTLRDPLSFPALTLVRGATLVTPDDDPQMELMVTGAFQMQCGATVLPGATGDVLFTLGSARVAAGALIDVTGRGYAGGDGGHPNGYAPVGVAGASGAGGGGSHGGHGAPAGGGAIYDSVFEPRLGGGGGATGAFTFSTSAGGGSLELAVTGDLVLDGELRARGVAGCAGGGGAGGAVLVHAGTVRGAGLVDASGGDKVANCIWTAGVGGGGRVAIYGALDGFDPAVQARAWGGVQQGGGAAAPGTVYFKTPAQALGVLVIDRGDTTVSRAGGATELPALASGDYRFDRLELRHGAALASVSPVVVTDLVVSGAADLSNGVSAQNLTLEAGAVLRPLGGDTLHLAVPGRLTVAAGARIDVSDRGYAGGSFAHPDGYSPAGVAGASGQFAGGAHGGRGVIGTSLEFDSVYEPHLAGGGGAVGANPSPDGQPGGGVLRIEAGELVLDGELRAGASSACSHGAGAGGTVSVVTGTLRGIGLIDVSGGDETENCAWNSGAGGGGRVSLVADALVGFDPAVQVKAWGGKRRGQAYHASPGTVYTKLPTHQFGVLTIDNGQSNGVDRTAGLTNLPSLGSGTVTGFTVAGADAWISRAGGFTAPWRGVWVKLTGAAGSPGSFKVVELGTDGRVRLAGAGSLQGVTGYAGEYRFDRVDLFHGSGYDATDPVSGAELVLQGDVEVTGEIRAQDVRIKSGAVVRLATGNELKIIASGKLTVEPGAVIDLKDRGYAGGTVAHPNGFAPAGVAGATGQYAGGAHGGQGVIGTSQVFDSVYEPRLGGGGGASGASPLPDGRAGGGVLSIEAAEVELNGELRVTSSTSCSHGAGAGGTVSITAGTLAGTGLIDASGGDETENCAWNSGAGGGGRVALLVDALSGFDPATQVKVWGGKRRGQAYYASPGTLYTKLPADTWGVLRIDTGTLSGANRVNPPGLGPVTALPVLGSGALTAVVSEGADARVSRSTAFPDAWRGTWMVLLDAAGGELGAFRVAAVDAEGKILLTGAGAVTGATTYRGEYRFDRVELAHGATLEAADSLVTPEIGGNLKLGATLKSPGNLLLKTGSTVVPVAGTGEVRFAVPGTLTIETGALIDVSSLGYGPGTAPAGLIPASGWANGGTHGGMGGIGEVYNSVYQPWLLGSGGTGGSLPQGTSGGGVVLIEAGGMVLNGEIRARGQNACGGGGGAGGTVRVRTPGTFSGTGSIDASGGLPINPGCGYAGNAGGGGRVALHVGTFSGFDPAARVNVQGGFGTSAGAGTLLTKTSAQTWGALRVDQRQTSGTPFITVLPSIGRGTIGATYPGTNPADLWIEPQVSTVKFSLGVAGIWTRVGGIDYPVLELSADRRRILLQGAAGAVAVGQSYLGIYKFDALTVAGRAKLELKDGDVLGTVTVESGSTLTRIDSTPPAVSITQPAAGTLYPSGQSVTIAATATDAGGIASVTFRFGGQSFTDTAAPYEWTVAAPVVEVEGDLPVTVTALDVPGNDATVTRVIRVRPLAPGNPPSVALTCPTPGALVAPGTGLDFYVTATSEAGIEKVELLLGAGTTPLATDTAAPYVLRFTVPAGGVAGDVLQVKLRARSYNGSTAEVVYPLTLVTGTVLAADTTLASTNLSLDGQSVVVAGGTLTLQGVHNFRDLVVLDGAKVTHSETTSTQVYTLDVGVERDLYVACGGSLDVTGRGYPGAPAGQRAYGYANNQTEGAQSQVGGGHGGRGGRFDGSSPVYGNVFDPRDPGAGGGYDGSTKGRDGGGVIRVTALGDVVIDGALLADGESGTSGGGAGGSIRIHAETLTGAGRLQANGSAGGTANAGGGSGGRVALYAAAIDAALIGRTTAAGAKTTATDASFWGAAGTLFVQRDADPFGELIVDNLGTASTQLTDLPAVRRGVVDAVGTASFTDNEADFRNGLAGVEVSFNDTLSPLYLVDSHSHHGPTLSLQVPAPPLSAVVHPGDTYRGVYRFDRVTVRGKARVLSVDRVLPTLAPTVESGAEWTESYTPTLQITSPAAGAVFSSGDTVSIAATVQDVLGVRDVVFRLGTASNTDTVSPWAWSPSAPTVTQPTDLVLSATATDHSGNRLEQSFTVRVNPLVDPVPPLVAFTGCVVNGDAVLPGVAVALPFLATDDKKIQSYVLKVDGQAVQTTPVGQISVSTTWTWTPPANAAPGQVFALQIDAVDYGGSVGSAGLSLKIPSTTVRTGTQTLTSSLDGTAVFLGAGTFTIQGAIAPSSLTLLSGAKVVGVGGQPVKVTTAGEVRVQCGASIDVTGQGYAGTTVANGAGGAPAGVAPAVVDGGGSHGGPGSVWIYGPPGEVFDSVYEPRLGGGGGSLVKAYGGYRSGAGGGTIDLTAGQLVLQGDLKARGEERPNRDSDTPGGGGTVVVHAGSVSGTGKIDASGGDYTVVYYGGGSGGGGRVALHVDSFQGFDPLSQVKTWGGTVWLNSLANRHAGPGTLYVKSAGDTYGRLVVDSGELTGGIDRVGPVTPLPVLGSGNVTAVEGAGSDLWVTAAAAFKQPWLGAWMELSGPGGASLGTFRVLEIDASGRVRLALAADAGTATSWRGVYRFDRLDLRNGAGLSSTDPLQATTVETDGNARLPKDLEAGNLTVKTGTATAAQSGLIRLKVAGTLRIEAGALLDVSGLGYPGTTVAGAGGAPVGVTPAAVDAGGSHGGPGSVWSFGPAGQVYDSVYEPSLGGGGGSLHHAASGYRSGAGGGVIDLTAGEIVLLGTLRARGEERPNFDADTPGAGGTVRVRAGVLSGTGTIDASGGTYTVVYYGAGSAGGGRVALQVDAFQGFDPVTQVKAWGGAVLLNGTANRYAGPGTVYVKTLSDTYGRLIVDSGEASGVDRIGVVTPLPALGTGGVVSTEGAGTDLWVRAAAAFKPWWQGAWMELFGATGSSLGTFRVLAVDNDRVLLDEAVTAGTPSTWRGVYRFDRIDLRNGAGLSSTDPLRGGIVQTDGNARLPVDLTADSLTLKAGGTATVAQGGTIRLNVTGTLQVEAGAVLDVTGLGYAGTSLGNQPGTAPAFVTAAAVDSGGSHGGVGSVWSFGPPGEVFDSVYAPALGGGGGSLHHAGSGYRSGSGGGVIDVTAGQLLLDGELRARGEQRPNMDADTPGAGGTVKVQADVLSGTGTIDASGGDYTVLYYGAGSAGGGRVALTVGSFSGFDPVAQVKVRGGKAILSGTPNRYGGPGTLFVKLPTQTYGRLIVDQGGVSGKPVPNTPLPSAGLGTVGVMEVDATDPAALWIEPADPNAKFALGVLGMWVRIDGADYRVVQQTANRRRVLLAGAAGLVDVGDAWRGVYKFDEVTVRGGAKLELRDTNEVGVWNVDSTSTVIQNVP